MQSCASNNGSPSKDAPSLNELTTCNFKCQLDSHFFAPIYKVKKGSVKKNVKLFFPVVHFFEASIAYLIWPFKLHSYSNFAASVLMNK